MMSWMLVDSNGLDEATRESERDDVLVPAP
jgi:hypothetical protein